MTDILVDLLAEDNNDFNSSSIDYVGYDRESKTLYVEFQSSGTVYSYEGVEESTYNLFIGADSLNRFWREHISGKYTSGTSTSGVLVKREWDTFDGSFDGQKWPGGLHPVTGEADNADTVLPMSSIFADSFLNVPLIQPTRFGVRYTMEVKDSEGNPIAPAGPFEPQFVVMNESDALVQFNKAQAEMERLTGWDITVKVQAVTHYFD